MIAPQKSLLTLLTEPASIAVIGASDDKNKVGGRPVDYLQRFGYPGRIYPINPGRERVQGLPAYASLAQLPETPDMAIIALAGPAVSASIEACAEKGVGVAVIMSSGFAEAGDEGKEAQRRLMEIAARAGMRLIGPNSQGTADFHRGAVANFSTMFKQLPPQDGPVAVISQSGATSAALYTLLREQHIGVRYVMATGNEADVTVSELAYASLEDSALKVLVLYMESIKDPEMLVKAAALARERGVPIIAIKAGSSEKGAIAAQSHTGALSGEDDVIDVFLRQHGIWRASDLNEIAQALPLYLKGLTHIGRKLVVISNSGSSCVMSADLADTLALPMAELSTATQSGVAAALASYATSKNPIDLTAALMGNSALLKQVFEALKQDDEAQTLLVSLPVAGEGYDLDLMAEHIAAFEVESQRLVMVSSTLESILAPFRRQGIATFKGEPQALRAMDQITRHRALLRREPAHTQEAPLIILPAGVEAFLSEADSLTALASAGLPVVPHTVCNTAQEAIEAWKTTGGPVVLKACSDKLPHKSEYGLVFLNLNAEAHILAAAKKCEETMQNMGITPSYVISPMEVGRWEMALGAKNDPNYGPVIMLSDGGKYIESMPDYCLLMPPFSVEDVRRAIAGLRIAPIFGGVRGEPPIAIEPLADMAIRLANLMLRNEDVIASVDLNPVLVCTDKIVVLDALIERRHRLMPGARAARHAAPELLTD
ncbi:CoA-binding protein [Pollutimonas subterranea]|uniref:CoA-binding protein n=1 Tax=Pollutimonas subterranea TaxID=2045210 RepID=A0A2N4TZK7_9BURK|nr:acetate--CoA ligase family protein [Pollutimonas subterranea]PLC48197.1 CoA-binding protein [Pollutimonas subterranea]